MNTYGENLKPAINQVDYNRNFATIKRARYSCTSTGLVSKSDETVFGTLTLASSKVGGRTIDLHCPCSQTRGDDNCCNTQSATKAADESES